MQRSGQARGRAKIAAPAVAKEMQHPLAAKQVFDAGGAAEVGQVRAATHADVLAQIDPITRIDVAKRSRPTAQVAPGLEERDANAGGAQGHGRRHARQTAADDGRTGMPGSSGCRRSPGGLAPVESPWGSSVISAGPRRP